MSEKGFMKNVSLKPSIQLLKQSDQNRDIFNVFFVYKKKKISIAWLY